MGADGRGGREGGRERVREGVLTNDYTCVCVSMLSMWGAIPGSFALGTTDHLKTD